MNNTQNNSSSSGAWAWATLGIVFIVFYFGTASRRESRSESDSNGESRKARSSQRVIVQSEHGGLKSRVQANVEGQTAEIQQALAEIDRETKDAKGMNFRSRAFTDSVKWLNQSMESLSERLHQISEEIEDETDKDVVETKIKKAFREAFVHSDLEEPNTDLQDSKVIVINNHGPDGPQDTVVAEVASDDAIPPAIADSLQPPAAPNPPNANSSHEDGVFTTDRPILGEGVPDWIRQRIVESDRVMIPIESSMHSTLEECKDEIQSKLPEEVRNVLDVHVLKRVPASSIPELTDAYIRENLVDRTAEFDNYQERPSGVFHQVWVKMVADKKRLDQIHEWEREILTQERVWHLGGLSGAVLGSLAGFSGIVNWLSRRERKRSHTL